MGERLAALRTEYERGCRQLELLDRKRAEVRDTLLRISGAIQVLEELMAEEGAAARSAAA